MRTITKSAIIIILLISLPNSLFAISPGKPQSGTEKKRKFRHDGSIVKEVDKESGDTRIMLRRMPLYTDPSRRMLVLELTAYFVYSGDAPSKPDSFIVGFVSFADEQRFVDFHDLTLKVDGETIELGKTEMVESKAVGLSGSRQYREIMKIAIPYEIFIKAIGGKKVDVELGKTRFRLDNKQLEALRDLASRTE